MKDIVKILSKNKNMVVLAVSSVVSMLIIIVLVTVFSHEKTYSKNIDIANRFCDGGDWEKLNKLGISDSDKTLIKGLLIKVSIESSALNGTPLLTSNKALTDYIDFIDTFYRSTENSVMPIFFALKIADLTQNNTDSTAIANYRLAVLGKLKNYGLIE
jgi:hypothetical protein